MTISERDTPLSTAPPTAELNNWLGIELRHLAALDAVETEGTFGRAAIKLGYTQSAVSQQIATLERIVGEKLIERPGGPRPVTMTEAGRLLLRHATSIVARLQAAQADLAALSAGEAGSLHVGIFQSVGAKILPEVMRRFKTAWPQVDVELRESHSDRELADLVERGILDVSFVQLPLDNPWLETLLVLRDDYVLVSAADSPFPAERRTPALREIAEQPLIGYRSCRATELVFDQIRASGIEPNVVFRSDENGVVQGLARRRDRGRNPPPPRGRRRRRRDPDHRSEPAHRRARDRDRAPQGPVPLAGRTGVRRDGARGRRRDFRGAGGVSF